MTPIGVNVTCNSNCTRWCPRVLKVKCCCANISDDESEESEEVVKVQNVAFENIVKEDSTIPM